MVATREESQHHKFLLGPKSVILIHIRFIPQHGLGLKTVELSLGEEQSVLDIRGFIEQWSQWARAGEESH